ncbi:MAG: hypothetical protein AAFP77_29860 [Bacteroidota bacterium]
MNCTKWTFRLAIFLFCLLAVLGTQAQGEAVTIDTFSRDKIPVLVEPMKIPADLPPAMVERIQLVAYTALERHWHFQVINSSTEENTGEVDPEYIFQLSLQPLVESLSQNDSRDTNGVLTRTNYFISEGIRLNLRITDIVTGELKYSQDVESIKSARGRKYFASRQMVFAYGATVDWRSNTNRYPFPTSPEMESQIILEEKNKLLRKALDEFPARWQETLTKIFPSPIHILSVVDGSAKKPKKVKIDAGADFGISRGYPLEAYTYKSYRALGEQFLREEVLGTFYPVEVGPNTTIGRIFGGRKEIGEALARGDTVFFRFKEVLRF